MTVARSAGFADFIIPAGGSVPFAAHAQFLRCLSSPADFAFSVDGGDKQFLAEGVGWTAPGADGFAEFRLFNPTGAQITVTVAWGWGELRDDRLTATGIVETNITNNPLPKERVPDNFEQNSNVVIASGTNEQVRPANALRSTLIVQNQGTNEIYLKRSTVSSASGNMLAPGERVAITTSDDVRAYNPGPDSVEIGWNETLWTS